VVVHRAPSAGAFTVRDLLAAVEETERRTRAQSEWFGGVDIHHCFFQGIEVDDQGVWRISWDRDRRVDRLTRALRRTASGL